MLMIGMAELSAAILCLFTDKKNLSLGVAAWLSANVIVHRIGLWSMGWRHSSGFLMAPLGLSLRNTDILVSSVSIFLFIGSITMLFIERQTAKATGILKMSCASCDGHIEFSSDAIGQKIQCPHCAKTITLSNRT